MLLPHACSLSLVPWLLWARDTSRMSQPLCPSEASPDFSRPTFASVSHHSACLTSMCYPTPSAYHSISAVSDMTSISLVTHSGQSHQKPRGTAYPRVKSAHHHNVTASKHASSSHHPPGEPE
ncbi:hypothetical protein EDD37DRAFT_403557 [Exophiala viscosa]|uniref:uncharacterized protein n=1 Tax=Exophiala viscosa TaxID=2486360 RepID=UPI00218CC69C|nr:hypothetical protein EDD37DRAFT_403557 [Exophiala viscosa]